MNSWKENLIKITPYTAGEQPDKTDFIKLNANENPYPPAPGVIKAITEFKAGSLNKYPDANAAPLLRAIADRLGVSPKNVFAGNGSDDVLALCFRAFFNSGKPVIFPDITYSFYPVWCNMLGIPFETPPLDGSFNIDPEDYKRENGGVVICNPNAPTSIGRGLDFIREILEANPDSVVISDEAYVDFGGISALPLLKEYPNLAVVQTFSKSRSMAGMRIGYCIAGDELISALRAAKDSYNSYPLDSVAIAAGCASLADEDYFNQTVAKIISTRDRLTNALRERGFILPDSSTNFLFAQHEKFAARDICEYLKTRDIYVRYFNTPRIDNRLRITIGTDGEIDKLIGAIDEYIGSH
ncbi:MAG: histidinol-phosphate transaminase [Oscillospiraceae bacterium]|nr:histidinol-phosphate transaminase [Oscillospiraceae bacterium]